MGNETKFDQLIQTEITKIENFDIDKVRAVGVEQQKRLDDITKAIDEKIKS